MNRIFAIALLLVLPAVAEESAAVVNLRKVFDNPPVDCRPHTRWWWMGNALSKADITRELEQMKQQGIGGVEQVTMQAVFTKGNHPYLSPGYFELLKHAIAECKRLGMEVSINFGGPGWIWGGEWVPDAYRNRNLLASSVEVAGGKPFAGRLPLKAQLNPGDIARSLRQIPEGEQLVAVVAGQEQNGRLTASSLVDLTSQVKDGQLSWQVPPGRWRLMAFWLVKVDEANAVNHISVPAMEYYTKHLGDIYLKEVGPEFGKTIESFFGDSFEVPIHRNGIYWSAELTPRFQTVKGYDLVRYLPALWWEVDDLSPKVRYDVNDYLAGEGMRAFFDTFTSWCERHGVKSRIQPYGFVTDNLAGAGASDIPEMEITAGEKDAVPWFDTRIGPREYVASGAHLYGRRVVSVEAYTYLHWEQARETMEELKISGDIFLRAGANKFYNSGFTATPEREFVPSRRFTAEVMVSPDVSWWRYYHLLSSYVARCSAVLRQGSPAADIAVYSPLANQWAIDVFNARRWTRSFEWGMLGKLLLANGYNFDLINDDVLQRHSRFDRDVLRVRDLEYRILIVPNTAALPVESMRRIAEFARQGGVVVALEQTPSASTGMLEHAVRDAEVKRLSSEMFQEPPNERRAGVRSYGQGETYYLKKAMYRTDPLDLRASAMDPFLNSLRKHVTPDVGINFVAESRRENDGLLFCHRKVEGADVYFLTNVQNQPLDSRIAFRVTGKAPEQWDPYDGQVAPLYEYDDDGRTTTLPIRLAPYESTLLVFAAGPQRAHVAHSGFDRILGVSGGHLEALASENGPGVSGIPAPWEIPSGWTLKLDGKTAPLTRLASWTDNPATRHFSGTGTYSADVELPASYLAPDMELRLDLGAVGDVAEVQINGQPAGVVWMRGRTLDVTKLIRPGTNRITIDVTNTLINRMSAMKEEPPLAPDLAKIYGAAKTSRRNRLYGFEPLPRSGLLGPVRIVARKRVRAVL